MNFAKPSSVFIIHQVHWDKLFFSKLYYIISGASSLVLRPFYHPVLDRLQYAKMEEKAWGI